MDLTKLVMVMVVLILGILMIDTFAVNGSVTGLFSDQHIHFAEPYTNADCMNAETLVLKDDVPDYLRDDLLARYDCSGDDKSNVRMISRMLIIVPMVMVFVLALVVLFKNPKESLVKIYETVEVGCSICGAVLGEVPTGEYNRLNLDEQYCVHDQHQHQISDNFDCLWKGCEALYSNGSWQYYKA